MIETARAFLAKLKISRFVADRDTFTQELDRQTKKLARAICKLPRVLTDGAKHWGTARKALNLFLSEVYYHRILCAHYGFAKVKEYLEVPLDSQVAHYLKEKAKKRSIDLPGFPRIKHLLQKTSDKYQEFAANYAQSRRGSWLRIHLDLEAWRATGPRGPQLNVQIRFGSSCDYFAVGCLQPKLQNFH